MDNSSIFVDFFDKFIPFLGGVSSILGIYEFIERKKKLGVLFISMAIFAFVYTFINNYKIEQKGNEQFSEKAKNVVVESAPDTIKIVKPKSVIIYQNEGSSTDTQNVKKPDVIANNNGQSTNVPIITKPQCEEYNVGDVTFTNATNYTAYVAFGLPGSSISSGRELTIPAMKTKPYKSVPVGQYNFRVTYFNGNMHMGMFKGNFVIERCGNEPVTLDN